MLVVALVLPDERPDGTRPLPYPERAVALYHMMWPDSRSPLLHKTPPDVNVLNLAFLAGDPLRLPGWASDGESEFLAAARQLRERGVRTVLSVGGKDGLVDLADRQAFVEAVMQVNQRLPLDGLDWDVEGGLPMRVADVVAISAELKRLRGDDFAITLAPNGSNIGHYLEIAVALQRAGHLTRIGQQFYDAPVTAQQAVRRIEQAVAAGVPVEKYMVGMMLGDGERTWTLDESVEKLRYVLAHEPEIGGVYLWEAGRPGTAAWAERMGELVLRST